MKQLVLRLALLACCLAPLAQAQVFVYSGTIKYTEINDGDTLRWTNPVVLILDTNFKRIKWWEVDGTKGKREIECWSLGPEVFPVLAARNKELAVLLEEYYEEYDADGDEGVYSEQMVLTGPVSSFSLGRGLPTTRWVRTWAGTLTMIDRVYDLLDGEPLIEDNWLTTAKVQLRLNAKATAAANNAEVPTAERFAAAVAAQLLALQQKHNVPDDRVDDCR